MKIISLFFSFFLFAVQTFSQTSASASLPAEVLTFQKGLEKYNDRVYSKAIEFFNQAMKEGNLLEDYSLFYRAQSWAALKQWKEAQADLEILDKKESHFKLLLDSRLLLSQVFFEMDRPAQVRPLLARTLRRVKNTEDESKVLFTLAKGEKLSKQGNGCRFLLELYKKFPADPLVAHWDADLDKNEFLGMPTDCPYRLEDFRDRMRSLLFAGLDKKAYAEMVLVSGRIREKQPMLSDVIRSQFNLQEGDTAKAYELLKPHVAAGLNDPEFLLNFASTASRAGDSLVGSSAYWYVARHFPKSKWGQRGLFLAAIMSYQFQDYDGAELRFKEFVKLYPNHSLSREAGWHLAWLDYLRGYYDSSISRLKALISKNKKNSITLQRLNYWLAMNYLKKGEADKAQEIFQSLAGDSLRGYYALAAQSRLGGSIPAKPKSPYIFARGSDIMVPSLNYDSLPSEEVDVEELATAFVIAEEERETLEDDAAAASSEESIKAEQEGNEFKTPVLARRFERAQALLALNLNQWAKWENYEIEKKTKNKDYLKMLIQEYQKLEQYHRSSQIAHLKFMSERSKMGFTGANFYWEAAYPKAFKKIVERSSSKESLTEDLVWAIMKQESQFKREAISPVGALGLMQVMPMTGYQVARIRGDKNFSPSDLLQPQAAIDIGTTYLKRLSRKMNDSYGLVAAAYNAGPHRVDIWTKSFGHLDADEYIEHIPFAETRNYVKRVLSNMQVYRELYGDRKVLNTQFFAPFDYKIKGPISLREQWDD